jgi:tripartite-type tricarboxylate transporter receptor subunit TctC
MDESGLKGYEAIGWYGLYGPARLPTPILTRIYEATRDGVRHPETRQALAQFNIEPADSTPAAFARFLREDLIKYGKIIKAAGIEPQ